jgi:hypothetical protein
MTRHESIPLLAAALLAAGCAAREPAPAAAPAAQQAFLAQYAPFCGAAYAGRSVLVQLGENNPLEGAALRMILERCTDYEVRIAFHVDADRSRTWVLRRTERGLHLSHDHRYPDGTEYPQNFYGGYATAAGSATRQFFPADERTVAERPAREINVWSKEFDLANRRYFYRLYLRGELRYEAEFDLARPLPAD